MKGRGKRKWQESAWLLGICEKGLDDLKAGRIHWIHNGVFEKKKWFADPFLLDADEKEIRLLVEEFDYQVHRGRIARIVVDRTDWTVKDCRILLDLETHLSFPMIWRESGTVFVCPENYQSGGWDLYRYDDAAGRLERVGRLIDEKLTDAVLIRSGEAYVVLSTADPTPNGQHLRIYRSEALKGPYRKVQDVRFEDNTARNAGMPFRYEGRWIRPAQESNYSYGHALVFQEMKVEDGGFSFEEIGRIYSPHSHFRFGIHTYNQLPDGLAVVDVKGDRFPFRGGLCRFVHESLVRLHLKRRYRFV